MIEPDIIMSPLCRTIEHDGTSLQVEIYHGDDSQWILEVVDEAGTSIVWDDQFATDQAALDEFVKTLDEEGVQSMFEDPADP